MITVHLPNFHSKPRSTSTRVTQSSDFRYPCLSPARQPKLPPQSQPLEISLALTTTLSHSLSVKVCLLRKKSERVESRQSWVKVRISISFFSQNQIDHIFHQISPPRFYRPAEPLFFVFFSLTMVISPRNTNSVISKSIDSLKINLYIFNRCKSY